MTDTGPGALASAMLSAAIAGRADPTRFGRGRGYVREGAVVDLVVGAGVLTASVLGSRPTPYRVTVSVPGAEPGPVGTATAARLNRLVPRPDELRCSCTCPDGPADPCKHAVAAVLAFAQQVAIRPELLAEWRSGEPASGDARAAAPAIGTRTGAATTTSARTAAGRGDPPRSPQDDAFLGDPTVVLPELPELDPLPVGACRVGPVDLAAVVADALDVIASTYHRPRPGR